MEFRAVRGVEDLIPPESEKFEKVVEKFKKIVKRAGLEKSSCRYLRKQAYLEEALEKRQT